MRYRLTFFGFLLWQSAISQKVELNNSVGDFITKSTPQAYQFQKYGDIPVSANTGVINLSIPLMSIGIRGVDWPIALSYQSSGIRVNELSGCVGLGWNLQAAGMISSKIYQESDAYTINQGDDSANRKTFTLGSANSTSFYVGPCQYYSGNDVGFVRNFFDEKANGTPVNYIPDIFYLSAGSLNAKFFLKNGKGYCLPSKDVSIEFFPATQNVPEYWIVKDEAGNKYTFKRKGDNSSQLQGSNGYDQEGSSSTFPFMGVNPTFALTKIENLFGESIEFFYSIETYIYRGEDKHEYRSYTQSQNQECNQSSGFIVIAQNRLYNYVHDARIDSIKSSKGEKIVFTYSSRNDLSGASKLDKISEYYITDQQEQFIKAYNLNHTYFGSGTIARELRLKLNGVDEVNVAGRTSNQYSCSYNSVNLPSRVSAAQDYAGYYNGQDNNTNLVPYYGGNRNFSLTYAKACVLEKITYPTGGYSMFDYELKALGGLRIKTIKDFAFSTAAPKVKVFDYPGSIGGSGLSDNNFKKDISVYMLVCRSRTTKDQISCPYTAYYSDRVMSLYDTYYGYGEERYNHVTEFNGENGEQGKTEYSYGQQSLNSRLGMMGQDDLLVEKITYKNNGNGYDTVAKETNEYEALNETESSATFYNNATNSREVRIWGLDFDSDKEEMETNGGDCATQPGAAFSWCYPARYWQQSFRLVSSPIMLKTEKRYAYSSGASQTLESSRTFSYVPNTLLAPTSVEEAVSNAITKKVYTFSNNYSNITGSDATTLGVKNLYDNHVYNTPIETSFYRKNTGSSSFSLVGANFIKYKTTLPLPEKIYAIETETGLSDFSPSSVNSGSVTKDIRYIEKAQFNSYTATGELLEQQKVNDVKMAYIWDYNQLPVATIINAAQSDVAYTSFESGGNGGWAGISSPSIVYSSGSLTGKKFYNQSGFSISKSGLSSSASYRVSYWSKNGAYSVNAASAFAGRSYNGWTYYEHTINNPSAGVITVAGSGAIDELRLYPKLAQMTTYTYEPLKGISSQCNLNNRVVYYQYDGFGRLFVVRDQNNKLLKKFCYNYYSQSESCTVFGNQAQTGDFIRNNCSPGYSGSSVTYTVTANTYYATSQEEANALALAEIAGNGITYANQVGTCSSTSCNSSNCSGENVKCINGTCEGGYKVYTSSYYNSSAGYYVCTYHYEWSDSSWSQNYSEISYGECLGDPI